MEEALAAHLPHGHPRPLFTAMERRLFAPGDRLHPIVVVAAAEAVGGDGHACLGAAAAVEIAYRACHRHPTPPPADEAVVERLAGEALLALAFELLADLPHGPGEAASRIAALHDLARCVGGAGRAAGEAALHLAGAGEHTTLPELEFIHTHIEGAWLTTAVRVGALFGGATGAALESLTRYAHHAGLALAIAADLQRDRPAGVARPSYARAVGASEARALAEDLSAHAVADLAPFGGAADPLRSLPRALLEGAH